MPNESTVTRRIARFGAFEADLELGELRRQGRVVALQEQPLLVLASLLEQPDVEVSREELRQRLWPDQSFLDFETGINTAVAKLRQALGDSAANPRFIVTRPRHGYRFIAPIRWVDRSDSQGHAATDWLSPPAPEPQTPRRTAIDTRVRSSFWLMAGVGALILFASLALLIARQAVWHPDFTTRLNAGEAASLEISAPTGESLTRSFALSPDGAWLAFVTGGATPADSRMCLRSLHGVAARDLPGTEGAAMPFWSPDSKVVGFFARGKLKTIHLESGAISVVADAQRGRGGSWSKDGFILFAPDINSSIFSVAATGGRAVPVTDVGDAPSHRFPVVLPDGLRFLYLVLREDRDQSEIWWGHVGGPDGGRLLTATSDALYMDPGYLFFARGTALLAQAFDSTALRLIGQPLVVSERVGIYGEEGPTGLGAFSVSVGGSLAVADHARPALRLSWFDRQGRQAAAVGPPGQYMSLDLAPDGTRAVVARFDLRKRSSDLLTLDFRTGVVTQVTDDPWPDSNPIWAPLSDRLAFGSLREGRWRNFVRSAGQTDSEQAVSTDDYLYSWFPDGKSLITGHLSSETGIDLWKVPLDPAAKPTPLVVAPGNQTDGQVSRDGRWLAYASDHEGQREIYIRDLDSQRSYRISSGRGDIPRWRRDGRELFYLSGRTLMSVSLPGGPSFQIGQPQRLFEPPLPVSDSLGELAAAMFGVAPDGSRFLFATPIQNEHRDAIHVLLHWSPAPPH